MTSLPTPAHDSGDPLSYLNAIEAVWLAADGTITRCPHCRVTHAMLPMSGTGWGVEVFHEDDCPAHEDNLPAEEFDGTDVVIPVETSEDW